MKFQESVVKKEEIEDKIRLCVNMIIDRVLEDRKKGILLSFTNSSTLKGDYEKS